MRVRVNIPEGAAFREMPRQFGFGRVGCGVGTSRSFHEWYVTIRIRHWRLFVALMLSVPAERSLDTSVTLRWWLREDCT